MEKDYKKQITLKYKQVQRLTKELICYVKEVEKNNQKLLKEQESGAEEYYINKSKEYIKDSENTRDAVKGKLRSYLDELISFIAEIENTEAKELEEFKTANDVIAVASDLFKENN